MNIARFLGGLCGLISIAGTIATSMDDFGVSRPTAPFVTVQPGVTIEVALKLDRSA